ncbi:STAS domain-containing protein [Streptomyces massasporeus]|uniref:STAS domain-containing protein n=1 Tax=Streptomyces massasporeus TaxID=67324 RepID=UPI00381C282F
MTHTAQADQPRRLLAEHRLVDGVRVVTLRGEIDHDEKDQLSTALLGEGETAPARIVADLSEVTFLDSSGINIFVAAYQQVSSIGGWVRIAGAGESVLRVLQLVGVDTIIACHPTAEQALTA